MSRRTFVAGAVGAAVVASSVPQAMAAPKGAATTPVPADPFTLGVASGDPLHNGVVLWTRLAPDPTTGGGMPDHRYRVEWEIADDEAMSRGVRRGRDWARPEHGHAVHADVRGLRSEREYFYRFRVDGHLSPVGRTRTAPKHNRTPSALSIGLVSCQRYNSNLYGAYDDLVAHDPDLVIHVGDYIYESGGSGARVDPLPESITLEQYRNRYGLYKQDPSLQAAHATAPWLFTWDDHEVENNYTSDTPEVGSSTPGPADFLARRAAAYQAYWEHMPTRLPPPDGADLRLHRRIRWGRLADFFVLDTRQYRDDQICGSGDIGARCDFSFDPATQVLGAEQESWLQEGLADSRAAWAVLAQQVIFSQMSFTPGPTGIHNLDQWDGYAAARSRVLDALAASRPADNVVLTGDVHAHGAAELLADFDDPDSTPLGAEFIGTSVASNGSALEPVVPLVYANNPHFRWLDPSRRGWVHHRITADEWTADHRSVDDARVPGSPVQTARSWVLPRGGRLTEA